MSKKHQSYTARILFFSKNIAMRYKDLKKPADDKFLRLTGMCWSTFNLMMNELRVQIPVNTGKGHPHKLPLEDRLLLCIE